MKKKSPGCHRGERCNLNRRRKNKPIEPIQATLPDRPIADFEFNLDSIRTLSGALQPVCNDPVRGQTRCPRCNYEFAVRSRTEYTPVSEAFKPFYQRALNGDLEALVDYFKESWGRADLGPAFYQCLGYLTAKGFPEHVRAVKAILHVHATGGSWEKPPAKLAIYEHWNKKFTRQIVTSFDNAGGPVLGPSLAGEISDWLATARKRLVEAGEIRRRHDLWRAYIAEKLPSLDVRTSQTSPYHKALKELFLLLAQTQPRISPSQAARKVACKIAKISESTISHRKSVGKS
jgi:hypothetical protein